MAALTFLETLKREVARMQAVHPEREGELARAHALILHGQVLPSADDPHTGQVLSSDGEKRYTVNGQCDCQAGQHGKACKHQQAWKLYQYIAGKVEAQATPEVVGVNPKVVTVDSKNSPLPEARASLNFKAMIGSFEVQMTMRDDTEAALLARLQALLKRQDIRPIPTPAPRGNWKRQNQGR
jgi:hypothetical protein